MKNANNFGKVYLIGAGPGDPGLLTLRAHAILEKADVVVYDRLVSPAILGMCNSNAKMVDVGKMPTHHKVKQSEINKFLVKFAIEMPGATIARLKGGDPFVFGRGGEEALELVAAGVEFEVVPGVTSAIAVPAYAGIPVSHRGIAISFHIITGHEKIDERRETRDERSESSSSVVLEPKVIESTHDEKCKDECVGESLPLASVSTNDKKVVELVETSATLSPRGSTPKTPDESLSEKPVGLDFETLAHCPGTLIFLMGIGNMDFIAHRLIECGKDPKTPLAFIEKGTTPFQRTVMATLETAGETIVREHVTAPAITIMGGVVELGHSLAWRKNLPLSGKRLVVTRAAKQASGISARLTALGAEVIETPMIETRPLDIQNWAELANYNLLAFTSVNGVESFFTQLLASGRDIRELAGKKIASVGKITEKKLLEYGIRCDYVPEDHTGEGLGKLLREVGDDSRILLLQGNLADDTLLQHLPEATRWVVYETLPVAELPEWKREAVISADVVVFASTSAVENFVATLNPQSAAGAPSNLMPHTSFCIGRMTEAAARKHGFETITSDETTMDSLVKKIVEYYA